MQSKTKPSFDELVKSEIQDLDESLSNILDIYGEYPLPLIRTYSMITKENGKKVGLKFDEHYKLSQDVVRKIKVIFDSDRWVL